MDDYQKRIQKDIMKQVNRGWIPGSGRRIKPIYKICGRCKKNPVENHHYLCNGCWRDQDFEKKILKIIREKELDVNNTEKIRNVLYSKHGIYISRDSVKKYVSNLTKRGFLKGGEKNG